MKKAQSTLGFAFFFMQNFHNTNIQNKLTVSKPTDEKKKNTFLFGFQINSLYNNGDSNN